MPVTMRVETKALVSAIQKFAHKLPNAIAEETDATAQEIAQVAARNASVFHDTGSESAGFYVKSKRQNGYGQAVSRSRSLNPRAEIVPEVAVSNPESAAVGNVVRHFEVNELGSPSRNRPARFMLRRAVEEVRPKFGQRVQNRVRKVAKEAGL